MIAGGMPASLVDTFWKPQTWVLNILSKALPSILHIFWCMADDTVMTSLNGTSDVPEEHSKSIPSTAVVKDKSSNNHYAADPEAQEMVIESLRAQIQDLFTQVTQLNSKLVTSYNRVSDLEDALHGSSAELRASSVKISQLELERTQHLAALNTGLLVEKHHVTAELNRLMEKATEEAAQRGQAESARVAIEKELDDLSASLFNQANTMVAEARYAQHVSERKAEDAEQALKGAEEAVSAMQQQVQALQQQKEDAERKTDEMRVLVGKGKWVERVGRADAQLASPIIRLLSSHAPYQEFLLFIAHLRQLHPSSPSPPAMSTLLPLPLMQRLSTEDSDPTVRLDLAPSLNWLSRRSVLAAIHTGHLTIEPMSSATLLTESSHLPNASISGLNGTSDNNITCALCGVPVFQPNNTSATLARSMVQSHPASGGSWSSGLFKKPANNSTITIPASQTPHSHAAQPSIVSIYPSQIYIFRISSPQTSAIPSIPLSLKSSSSSNPVIASGLSPSNHISPSLSHSAPGTPANTSQSSTAYPLCSNGWCLARLRSTCSLWAFVRTGIVEKIWEEEIPAMQQPARPSRATSQSSLNSSSLEANPEKPPIPPRRRGFWGLASAIGERAASWSETRTDKEKAKKPVSEEKERKGDDKERKLPTPPPLHPQEAQHSNIIPPRNPASLDQHSVPPLPKRSGARARTHSDQSSEPAAAASETQLPLSDTPAPVPSAPVPRENLAPPPPASWPTSVLPPTSPTQPSVAAVPTPPLTPTRVQHSPAAPPPIPPRAAKRLSANIIRPGTPTSVPLPDSRPGTPIAGGATNPPSRTQSPALPGASGTGTPPPLPRRAASRARKIIDNSGTAAGSGESRSATPEIIRSQVHAEVQHEIASVEGGGANKNVAFPSTTKEEKRTSQSSVQLETVREETKSEVTVRIDGPETAEESPEPPTVTPPVSNTSNDPIVPRASPVSDAGSDQFVDAEDDLPRQKEEAGNGHKDLQATSQITAGQLEQGKMAQQMVSLNNGDLPPPLPPRKQPREAKETSAASKIDDSEDDRKDDIAGDDARKGKEEGDWQAYIGDATWEERTWKELTRLREEMFWARIGAIRS